MAVTKTFRAPEKGSIYGSRYMSLKLEEINIDIKKNTSDIKWTLTVAGDSYYYDTGVQIYINGTKAYVKEVGWSGGFPAKPGSTNGTITGIKHDDSTGVKTIDVSFKVYVYEYTYKEYGGTMELSTIPRTTECPNLDGYIESGAIISLNPASDTFKHRLYYSYNGKTGYYPSSDGFFANTGTLPLDTSFYSYTPKSTGTGDITLYTYTSDGMLIGSSTGTITVRCDKEKCKPTITATIIDVNSNTTALTDSDAKLVKGYSTAQITYTITPRNGATISSKKVNNTTLGTSPHKITNVSTGTFEIVAVDSRGFDTTETYNNTLINYVPLTLDFNAFRPTPTGSAIAINFQGNYFNGSFGSVSNTLALSWKYRLKGASSWTNGGTFTSGTDYTISGNKFTSKGDITLSDTLFLYQNNYELAIYYADKLVNTSTSKPVPKGKPVLNWEDDLVNVNGVLTINEESVNKYLPTIPAGGGLYETHYMQLGYIECSLTVYDLWSNITLLISSTFYGVQHWSTHLITLAQAEYVQTGSIRLGGNGRTFYYKIDTTNKRIYLYVEVWGGNGFGYWNVVMLNKIYCNWVSEEKFNVSKDDSWVEVSAA